MRNAPHRGEVWLDVPGVGETRLRYDWSAIAELHGAFGKAWEAEVTRACSELDASAMAKILAIGSEHPAEWWTEKSPPFVPAAQAMQEALHLAFFGAGGVEKNPPLARRLTTLLQRLGKRGSSSAGAPMTSGA